MNRVRKVTEEWEWVSDRMSRQKSRKMEETHRNLPIVGQFLDPSFETRSVSSFIYLKFRLLFPFDFPFEFIFRNFPWSSKFREETRIHFVWNPEPTLAKFAWTLAWILEHGFLSPLRTDHWKTLVLKTFEYFSSVMFFTIVKNSRTMITFHSEQVSHFSTTRYTVYYLTGK